MSFNVKYYIMAEDEIKRRKMENERLLSRRFEEIEQKIPEYRQMRIKTAATGNALVQAFLAGGEQLPQKVRELEKTNLDLQRQMEQLLISFGYPKNYLDDIYSCSRCKDTGLFNNHRCQCFMDIVRQFASEDLNSFSPMPLSDFSEFDLSYYPDSVNENGINIRKIMAENFAFCKRYADDFHLPCTSILMRGATGLGKTHLSLAIAKNVLRKNFSVIYGSAPDLLRKMEQEHFGAVKGNTSELLLSVDLLIFDDLGAEFDSKFYKSAVYNIINSRLNSRKPMIISTNYSLNELNQYYGDRITSRLMTMETLTFYGKDIRIIKKFSE